MINIQYILSHDQSSMANLDLAVCSPAKIHYYTFVGDIIFIINNIDFSAKWDWVPILDFGIDLCRITYNLQASQKEEYEFTESTDAIYFELHNGNVRITTNYVGGEAFVQYEELKIASLIFLTSIINDFYDIAPALKENAYILDVAEQFSIRIKT